MNSDRRRRELADFLQSRRKRLSPQELGLQAGASRRRTPGLRREEVASLSGISIPWYTALEQGRDIQVSEQVLESLVRTLKLSPDERNYLFILANPSLMTKAAEESTPPALQAILDRMGTYPAYVIDKRWNISAWNQMTSTLCGELNGSAEIERNILWRVFVMERNKASIVNWEHVSSRLLAHFRNRYAWHLNDPWYQELISKLHDQSEEFRAGWERHEVAGNSEGDQVIQHPEAGRLAFRYHTFAVSENSDFFMRVYTPLENNGSLDRLVNL
ncbi:helix-turn-helix transcriptional regulator [Paenibacillus filicis]|uniref:Helix-turn-helix transcriptional regulator n=1 Tax=Paenibacillus filicis TaxID=669464 RepID=A0ABU9DLB1_9BACL